MFSQKMIGTAVLIYFAGINLFYFVLIMISFIGIISHQLKAWFATANEVYKARITPPVSIIAPAYNEELSIIESIGSLLELRYNEYEVIIVNDGSTDSTFRKVNEHYRLKRLEQKYYPDIPTRKIRGIYRSSVDRRLVLVDKENGGKADALNAGINISIYPLFCAIDSDSVLEKDALLRLVHPFMENYRDVIATGGLIRIINACTLDRDGSIRAATSGNWLVNMQIVEYFRAFLVGRIGLNKLNCNMIISGAYGLFKKQAVKDIGGYRTDVMGEDMELVVRLLHRLKHAHRHGRIQYIPDTVCWTEVPEKMSVLAAQRDRWHRGLIESIFLHIKMLFNPGCGTIGFIGMPYYLFVEILNPFVELAGYAVLAVSVITGKLDHLYTASFLILTIGIGILYTALTLIIEELFFHRYSDIRDIPRLLGASLIESLGYHQILTLVKIRASFKKMLGIGSWGKMERVGIRRSE